MKRQTDLLREGTRTSWKKSIQTSKKIMHIISSTTTKMTRKDLQTQRWSQQTVSYVINVCYATTLVCHKQGGALEVFTGPQ
uniref:Uncharacterized protein n=1 Tax=Arion vulgaris TaxID=1028688 RepID=A0A0B7BHT9_9EUPU